MDVDSLNVEPKPASERANGSLARIELDVNGDPHTLPAPSSVADLLDALDLRGKRVAVAVERAVILRSQYADVQLNDGDRVEILEAVGGG